MVQNNIKYFFFTKNNGFSKGIYSSLNCGKYSKDNPLRVTKNLEYAKNKLGLSNRYLILPKQNHSNKCLLIKSPIDNKGYADALVTKSQKIILGITTADCLPIIFFDRSNRVIGVCHAGWRGISKGIIEETIKTMIKAGSSHKFIESIIGPCIRRYSYEVKKDFLKKIEIPNIENYIYSKKHRIFLDLPKIAKEIIMDLKIKSVKDTKKNTYLDANYFSYRKSIHSKQKDYGRNLSLIAIK